MTRNRVLLTGIAAVITASAGTLLLGAGPAAAAPACRETDAAKSCVELVHRNGLVKSVRINGQCLLGSGGFFPDVRVSSGGTPAVRTYGGAKCEGNTENSSPVRWTRESLDGYRVVTVLPRELQNAGSRG